MKDSTKDSTMLTTEQRAKRVAIAQDVLLQMAAGRYRAEHGTYLETTDGREIRTVEELAKLKRCDVCAMGAVFASKVSCFDAAPPEFSFATQDNWKPEHGSVDRNLAELFPDIRIIESVFEDTSGYVEDRWDEVLDFGTRGADRLAVIMLEIIASDGELVQ